MATASPASSRSTTPRAQPNELPSASPAASEAAAALSALSPPNNASSYTLQSITDSASTDATVVMPEDDGELVVGRPRWYKRPLVQAAAQVVLIFVLCSLVLGGTLWLALPRVKPEDRHLLRIPRNFEDLQGLNALMKRYRRSAPLRVAVCWIATYLFAQAFCIPGSMYLSILGGAMWGVGLAVPIICVVVAFGSTLCYALSKAFGPALLAVPKWRTRIEGFGDKVDAQRANLFSYIVILRISPVPHWLTNLVAPHVRIGVVLFWLTSLVGAVPLAVIHATIGGGLEQMTSPDDFHLFSLKNMGLLLLAVAAALVPVALRKLYPGAAAAEPAKQTNEDDSVV